MERIEILVTGASGFIGKNLVLELAKTKVTRILVRRTSNVEAFKHNKNIEIFFGDIENGEGLGQSLDGIEGVIHCAARTTGRCFDDYYISNVVGTVNLIAAMERGSVRRLLYLSSQAVCGTTDKKKPVNEDDKPMAYSNYGFSKKLAEDAVIASSLDYIILRPPSMYGPHDVEMLKYIMMLNSGFCPIVGSGEKYFSFMHVGDLVRLIIKLTSNGFFNRRIYFTNDGNCYSFNETVRAIMQALDKRPPIKIHIPTAVCMFCGLLSDVFLNEKRVICRDKIRELARDCWLCSNERLTREIGFKPQYNLADGMADTVRWYRRNGWL